MNITHRDIIELAMEAVRRRRDETENDRLRDELNVMHRVLDARLVDQLRVAQRRSLTFTQESIVMQLVGAGDAMDEIILRAYEERGRRARL